MKMKFWDRLALRLGGLITLLAGGVSLAAGILLWKVELGEEVWMKYMPWALVAAGALVIVYALFALIVPRRYAPRRRAFVRQATELGELRISIKAIENLILKCVETHKEVKVQDMAIMNKRGTVKVAMRVSMNSNVSIPHAVEQLQSQIKRYLAASSGIEVRDISVSVERAAGDEANLTKEPLPTVAEVKAEEKVEKIPMHQRVFGRDPEKTEAEQIAEAELIAVPVEEPKSAEAEKSAETAAAEPVSEEKAAEPASEMKENENE